MSFDTLTYLMFLPCVALAHYYGPRKLRMPLLLLASLVFYACWNVPFTLLLLFVILMTYAAALLMDQHKKIVFGIALCLCFGILIYFKYFRFTFEQALLPVGISFYIFQAAGYVIDVYKGRIPAEKNLFSYALFISFFPQLVAGPIEKAERLLPQLKAGKQASREDREAGICLLLSGYFRKIVIADFCGKFVDIVFAAKNPNGMAVCAAALLFGLQIYCDFAGYSEIAAGSARLLGIRLMRNFNQPYAAKGFHDFWRRWHISLTDWFRKYVYIPVGGSRHGRRRQIAVVFLVFTLSGLWHGSDWTFLLWGLYHGAFMMLEIVTGDKIKQGFSRVKRVLTFAAVNFAWIFFRANDLSQAGLFIHQLFTPWKLSSALELMQPEFTDFLWLGMALAAAPVLIRLAEHGFGEDVPASGQTGELSEGTSARRRLAGTFMVICILLAWLVNLEQTGGSSFIYFQF